MHSQSNKAPLSSAPCPYCGEYYELRRKDQARHVQNSWCVRQAYLEYQRLRQRERYWKKVGRPDRNHRDQNRLSSVVRYVPDPTMRALGTMKTRYKFLMYQHSEDCRQIAYVALLSLGIDPFSPAEIDVAQLNRTVQRMANRAVKELGYRVRQRTNRYFVSLDAVDRAPRSWAAAWASA